MCIPQTLTQMIPLSLLRHDLCHINRVRGRSNQKRVPSSVSPGIILGIIREPGSAVGVDGQRVLSAFC